MSLSHLAHDMSMMMYKIICMYIFIIMLIIGIQLLIFETLINNNILSLFVGINILLLLFIIEIIFYRIIITFIFNLYVFINNKFNNYNIDYISY